MHRRHVVDHFVWVDLTAEHLEVPISQEFACDKKSEAVDGKGMQEEDLVQCYLRRHSVRQLEVTYTWKYDAALHHVVSDKLAQ